MNPPFHEAAQAPEAPPEAAATPEPPQRRVVVTAEDQGPGGDPRPAGPAPVHVPYARTGYERCIVHYFRGSRARRRSLRLHRQLAWPGTSVTISGTNFETTVANDRASFNVMRSTLSSATATSIATTVPSGATSGHISVATPSGKAISTGDFFAPPAPYTASDVVITSRMAIGANSTITFGTANKVA